MAIIEEGYEEFTACVCLIIGGACLFVGFFVVVGLMMAVMALSFTLPFHIFKSLRVTKNGKFIKIQYKKLLNRYYNYHYHLGNSLQFY